MLQLAAKYTPDLSWGWTVLLTGATGHLGVHLLDQLTRMKTVSRVICLSRLHQGEDAKSRQRRANELRGVDLSDSAWEKISYLSSSQFHGPNLGLLPDEYRLLLERVTNVLHTAWPMDFQRTLSSFEPQIQTVRRLVDLCVQCHQVQGGPHVPRLLFTSSIAVGAHYSGGRLPEIPISDPLSAAGMGYAQAKGACTVIYVANGCSCANKRSARLEPFSSYCFHEAVCNKNYIIFPEKKEFRAELGRTLRADLRALFLDSYIQENLGVE